MTVVGCLFWGFGFCFFVGFSFFRKEPGDQVCVNLSFPSSVQHIFWLASNFMLRWLLYNTKCMAGISPARPPKSRTGANATLGKPWRTRICYLVIYLVIFLQSGLWICVSPLPFQNYQCLFTAWQCSMQLFSIGLQFE